MMNETTSSRPSPARTRRRPLPILAFALLATGNPTAGAESDAAFAPAEPGERIVNGVTSAADPPVAAILDRGSQTVVCTATLIGCSTLLTAAHCFCDGDTAASCGGVAPSQSQVFLQHAGLFDISRVRIHPSYEFGTRSDLAIVELARQVTGIAPATINTSRKPPNGTIGNVVGFGITDGNRDDAGIKRRGKVRTARCSTVPDSGHVCWNFESPVGGSGQDSNTCSGDSGGPLFVDFGQGPRLAGVTSGGDNENCRARDTSFDADVFANRSWIRNTARTLGSASCGGLPAAGTAGGRILVGKGRLTGSQRQERFEISVPASPERLRISLNGEDGADFDLYARRGAAPSTSSTALCGTPRDGVFEHCDLVRPAAGTYHVLVDRFRGSGSFQLVSTVFGSSGGGGEGGGGGGGGGGSCTAGRHSLCLQRGRFEIAVDWNDFDGDAGRGSVLPIGSERSGLFWFFDAQNVEMLVKVLDGCSANDRFWVFYAATTTVGFDLRVTDTRSGRVKNYRNPLGRPADAVADTAAFATCP